MIGSIISVIILGYLVGVGCALDACNTVEQYNDVKFTKKEKVRLSLYSWYTCIVLNSIIGK